MRQTFLDKGFYVSRFVTEKVAGLTTHAKFKGYRMVLRFVPIRVLSEAEFTIQFCGVNPVNFDHARIVISHTNNEVPPHDLGQFTYNPLINETKCFTTQRFSHPGSYDVAFILYENTTGHGYREIEQRHVGNIQVLNDFTVFIWVVGIVSVLVGGAVGGAIGTLITWVVSK